MLYVLTYDYSMESKAILQWHLILNFGLVELELGSYHKYVICSRLSIYGRATMDHV